jgi:hypothetical protein
MACGMRLLYADVCIPHTLGERVCRLWADDRICVVSGRIRYNLDISCVALRFGADLLEVVRLADCMDSGLRMR